MEQQTFPLDGHCNGPLFGPLRLRRAPVRIPGKEGVIHRAQTRRRTPPWADLVEIKKFYDEAARMTALTGELYVVDHIVPKMGGIVSGLHVPANLRVIHWLENARKGAFWWPDMPFEQVQMWEGADDTAPTPCRSDPA